MGATVAKTLSGCGLYMHRQTATGCVGYRNFSQKTSSRSLIKHPNVKSSGGYMLMLMHMMHCSIIRVQL